MAFGWGPDPGAPISVSANTAIHEVPVASDRTWSVAILSDIQGGFIYLRRIYQGLAEDPPDAIIVLGDLASRADEAHMRLVARFLALNPTQAPIFVVPGNHDVGLDGDAAAFEHWFASTSFDFRIGLTRFIGFDNARVPVGAESPEWLEEKLREASVRGEEVVLCMHRPILPQSRGDRASSSSGGEPLLDLIRTWGVSLVLAGHGHEASQREWDDGTRFVVVPPSGDRSFDAGQAPISFLLLHGRGRQHSFELVRFYRDNVSELSGVLAHLALAHTGGWASGGKSIIAALLPVGVAVGYGGWLLRRRRRRSAS